MPQRIAVLTRIARLACAALFLIGVLGLVGWHAEIPALLTVPAWTTPFRYNAALSFTLLAIALWGHLFRLPRTAAMAAASVALSLGCVTLSEYIFGLDTGLDEFLYGISDLDQVFFHGSPHARRMSPNVAFGITVGAAAVLLLALRRTSGALAAVGAAGAIDVTIGLTAVFGYAVGLPSAFVWGELVPLAPPGAAGLCALGIALFSAAWQASTTPDERIPGWIPLPIGLIVVTIGVVLWKAAERVTHVPNPTSALAHVLPFGVLAVTVVLAAALSAAMAMFLRSARKQRDLARAQAELRRHHETLRKILDVLPVGVYVADDSGQITMSNQAGREIWAGTRYVGVEQYGEYKGWWPDTGARIQAEQWALARALRDGEAARDEVVDIEAFDGTRKTILNSSAPVILDGRISGAVVAILDITSRRQMERALAARTQELERSNADLEQFAYVASHDLQEPLRMVASFTQLLARRYEGRLGPEADEYIGFVVDGARRMQRLLDDLLDYSRVGTRGKSLTATPAATVVDEAIANLRLAIEESGARTIVEPLPLVLGDGAQLVQVFQNLIANAIKFRSEERPPEIRISAEPAGGEYVFTVEDNGIGIEPRHAQRIFIIFHRLDRSGRYPGTGLGLAICKRIISRHGGRIWVESEAGSGARFCFTLRAAAEIVQPSTEPLEYIA